MSETLRFSSKDLKTWLERETSSLFVPIHSRAEKLTDEMRKALANLSDSSKMLLENSAKEIEKRNMKTYGRARALNKLARLFVDRMRQTKVPDKVTYDSFQEFVQETQRAFAVTDVDIRNYFPRVSPFFILDRRKFQLVFERAKETLKELNSFMTREYVKTKTLEETFQLIDKLQALEIQLVSLKEKKTKIDGEAAEVDRQIAETEAMISDMKGKGSLGQLGEMSTEIEALSAEVKSSLHHLQKPFIKLQSLAMHGEGSGLTPEETSKLNQYVEDPFEAFATEDNDHPLLKQILKKLDRAMSEGKLKLKPEKTRKAEQVIENILSKNSLAGLHEKSVSAMKRRTQLSQSSEVAETERELARLRERLEAEHRRRKIVEGERVTVETAINEAVERIKNHKAEIERNILSSMNKKVHIE